MCAFATVMFMGGWLSPFNHPFFNHLLILNTDIFKINLKSKLIEDISQQSLNYSSDNFSDKNKQSYIQFFNLYYPSLAQHKEKYHWLETLSLTQYLNEIIPKISPHKYLTYQQQMKRIVSEEIVLAFGEYIQFHPLIKYYNENGNLCIEDNEKKIQNEKEEEDRRFVFCEFTTRGGGAEESSSSSTRCC